MFTDDIIFILYNDISTNIMTYDIYYDSIYIVYK